MYYQHQRRQLQESPVSAAGAARIKWEDSGVSGGFDGRHDSGKNGRSRNSSISSHGSGGSSPRGSGGGTGSSSNTTTTNAAVDVVEKNLNRGTSARIIFVGSDDQQRPASPRMGSPADRPPTRPSTAPAAHGESKTSDSRRQPSSSSSSAPALSPTSPPTDSGGGSGSGSNTKSASLRKVAASLEASLTRGLGKFQRRLDVYEANLANMWNERATISVHRLDAPGESPEARAALFEHVLTQLRAEIHAAAAATDRHAQHLDAAVAAAADRSRDELVLHGDGVGRQLRELQERLAAVRQAQVSTGARRRRKRRRRRRQP
jgi:hypothetical protein